MMTDIDPIGTITMEMKTTLHYEIAKRNAAAANASNWSRMSAGCIYPGVTVLSHWDSLASGALSGTVIKVDLDAMIRVRHSGRNGQIEAGPMMIGEFMATLPCILTRIAYLDLGKAHH